MKIAIVDDDDFFLNKISDDVIQSGKNLKTEVETECFSSPKELIYELQDGRTYDAFFLDFSLGEDNGFELSEQISQYCANPYIVFVTAFDEKAIDAYKMQAYRFIPKNDMEDRIYEAIQSLYKEKFNFGGRYYVLQTPEYMERIYHNDILYLYKEGKYSVIVTFQKEMQVRKTLKEIYRDLPKESFIFINKSCIVHLMHVMRVERGRLFVRGDIPLDISRPQSRHVRESIFEYWKERT